MDEQTKKCPKCGGDMTCKCPPETATCTCTCDACGAVEAPKEEPVVQ